jgi:hypothetical protein
MSHIESTIQITAALVEALADDEGQIDIKCFEKICNAFIKASFIAGNVGDHAADALKQILQQVGPISQIGLAMHSRCHDIINICLQVQHEPSEDFLKDFKDRLLKAIKNAVPLVRICTIRADSLAFKL